MRSMIDSESGVTVVIGLIVLALLLAAGSAYLMVTTGQAFLTGQSTQTVTSYEMALAGRAMVCKFLTSGHTNGWTDELTTSQNQQGTYDPNAAPLDIGTNPTLFQWARDISYHNGRYWAIIIDNNDGDGNPLADIDDQVNVDVHAFFPGGNGLRDNETIIRSLLRYKPPLYQPQSAVVVGGSLAISGNATISGTQGSVYANGDLDIGGSSYVQQSASSTGDITLGGSAQVDGGTYAGAEPAPIPPINPTDYQSYADYKLKADGKVYDGSDNFLGNPPYNGWSFSGGTWSYNDNTCYNGTYYIEGNAEVQSSPGSAETPWQTTIIATGYIDVAGTPSMTPDSPGVILLAGTDLRVNGGASNVYTGLLAAHEQIKLRGTPNLNGSILAEDAEDFCPLVSTGSQFDVSIGGTSSITYNGGLETFIKAGDPATIPLNIKQIK